jgi:hypothetical protein
VVDSEDKYFSEESVLIKVSGDILTPITTENIALYRGTARSAAEIKVNRMDEKYYIHFDLKNKVAGNYSLRVEDFEYVLHNKNIKEDLVIRFEVLDSTAPFSVSPRIVFTSKNFDIYLKNLDPYSKEIKVETTNDKKVVSGKDAYTLGPGKGINVPFEVLSSKESGLEEITFSEGDHSKKVIVRIEKYDEGEKEKEKKIEFAKEKVSLNVSTNVQKTYITHLKNTGEDTVTNITLEVSKELKDFVSLSVEEANKLESNESIKIEIYVNTSNESGEAKGYILARDDSRVYGYLYTNMKITPDYVPNTGSDEGINPFAGGDDVPGGENGSELIDDENKGINTKTIGWIIILVLVAVIAWFFLKKYRGQKMSGIKFQLGNIKKTNK